MIHKSKIVSILSVLFFLFSTNLDAQRINTLVNRGKDLYEIRAYTQAIEVFQQVADRKQNHTVALSYLGECYRQLNQMEEAANNYVLAAQRENRMEDEHLLNFGKTLKALGRYDEARDIFERYANRNPTIGNHFAGSCEFARTESNMQSDFSVKLEKINSASADFGVSFFLDQVVFSSGRTDVERSTYDWDGLAKNQLFATRLGLDGYLQPASYFKGTSSTQSEGPASFTPDGQLIAFTRNDFISGIRQDPANGNELSLFIAEINRNGGWVNEKTYVHNDPNSKTGYPCFTPDGTAMFFASDRPGGYGGYDIYISYYENGIWSIPINLGEIVNSPGNEITPFFDGQDLYFASDYQFGFGGYDVFKAQSRNEQWAVVTNLGTGVNSPRDDYGFIFDNFKNIGYFTSNRPDGFGAEDIYKVTKAGSGNLVLKIVNAGDGLPISFANLDFSGCQQTIAGGNTKVVADSRGAYTMPIPENVNCDILISSPGFIDNRYTLRSQDLLNGGEIEIPLSREGQEYYGQVVSYTTQRPLEGIKITARNLTTGSTAEVRTDAGGRFKLGLQPNTAFLVIYSGIGYREIRRNVSTATLDQNGLGILSLYPSNFNPNDQPGPNPPPPPNNNPPNNNKPGIQAGYAIQLGALGKAPALTKYSNLNSVGGGQVYIKPSGNIYKIRYGVFQSRAEANRFLSSVRSRGYRDAFITAEDGNGVNYNSPDVPNQNPPQQNPDNFSSQVYKIQLVALRNTRFFDPSAIRNLGRIEDRQRNGLTIKLLASFPTVNAARTALNTVKRNGFPTAFIVLDRNGVLERVK